MSEFTPFAPLDDSYRQIPGYKTTVPPMPGIIAKKSPDGECAPGYDPYAPVQDVIIDPLDKRILYSPALAAEDLARLRDAVGRGAVSGTVTDEDRLIKMRNFVESLQPQEVSESVLQVPQPQSPQPQERVVPQSAGANPFAAAVGPFLFNKTTDKSGNQQKSEPVLTMPTVVVTLHMENAAFSTQARFHGVILSDDDKYLIFVYDTNSADTDNRTIIHSAPHRLAVQITGDKYIYITDPQDLIKFTYESLEICMVQVVDKILDATEAE